ncbi:MAG: SpoIVB peptidase [Peptococcaceae bacterium]|nr:SpoIVB peptidase [Peptococcaceae bacterium]
MEKESCRSILFALLMFSLAVIFCFCSYSTITFGMLKGLTVNVGVPAGLDIIPGYGLINKLQKLSTNVISQVKVIPGGQSIGIVMHSKGVIVVGMSDIIDESGKRLNPAEEAGIKVGDLILGINGKKITSEIQLRNEIALLGNNHQDAELEVKREAKVFKTRVRIVRCKETGRPRVGLYVRDTASGVGTISFYHPESGKYGALGHIITDVDTAKGIDLCDGKIVEASIMGIHRGKKGRPGEKVGTFIENGKLVGKIEKNSRYGIFGQLKNPLENPFYEEPVPVASSYQIRKGPAEILTVIDGTEIKKYSVEIVDIFYPWNIHGKGMIIKVNDQELIKNTGGIIQGMSGSPIIQDGMLAGVVTHVFINDPLCGYGVPAEWMIREAGLIATDKNLQKAS